MANSTFLKTTAGVLPYKFDWSEWLGSGETISTKTVTADDGITVDSSSITDSNTSVTVRLSGGSDNKEYKVTCEITTSDSNTDSRTMTVMVRTHRSD